MKHPLRFVAPAAACATLAAVCLILLAACASSPAIRINYQLPDQAPGRPPVDAVRLKVEDERPGAVTLTPIARKKLKYFSGAYALVMAPKGEEGPVTGIYDLTTLVKTVFEKRLARMGIRTVEDAALDVPEMNVALTRFQLDLRNYKWHFDMSYDLKLVQNGQVLVKQTLTGRTERVDVPGADDSGTTVSEIFADLINQPDMAALLEKAAPPTPR